MRFITIFFVLISNVLFGQTITNAFDTLKLTNPLSPATSYNLNLTYTLQDADGLGGVTVGYFSGTDVRSDTDTVWYYFAGLTDLDNGVYNLVCRADNGIGSFEDITTQITVSIGIQFVSANTKQGFPDQIEVAFSSQPPALDVVPGNWTVNLPGQTLVVDFVSLGGSVATLDLDADIVPSDTGTITLSGYFTDELLTNNIPPTLLAFPQAAGFGAYAEGIRNLGGLTDYYISGDPADSALIIEVTNCNDTGAGSFRQFVADCTTNGGNCVGLINIDCYNQMGSAINIDVPNVTVYKLNTGGDGYYFVGFPVRSRASNHVVRGVGFYNNFNNDSYEIQSIGSPVKRWLGYELDLGLSGDEAFATWGNRSDSTEYLFYVSLGNTTTHNSIGADPKGPLINSSNHVKFTTLWNTISINQEQRGGPKISALDADATGQGTGPWPPYFTGGYNIGYHGIYNFVSYNTERDMFWMGHGNKVNVISYLQKEGLITNTGLFAPLMIHTELHYHPDSSYTAPVGQEQYTALYYEDIIPGANAQDTVEYLYGSSVPGTTAWSDGEARFRSLTKITEATPIVEPSIIPASQLADSAVLWGPRGGRNDYLEAAINDFINGTGNKKNGQPIDPGNDLNIANGLPRDVAIGRPAQTNAVNWLGWLNGLMEPSSMQIQVIDPVQDIVLANLGEGDTLDRAVWPSLVFGAVDGDSVGGFKFHLTGPGIDTTKTEQNPPWALWGDTGGPDWVVSTPDPLPNGAYSLTVTRFEPSDTLERRTANFTIIGPVAPLVTDLTDNGLVAGCDSLVNGNNLYQRSVTVTYTNPPPSGLLEVNSQTFAITTSPQNVTLTNLNSDGQAVDVTAFFTFDPSSTRTETSLFTAEAQCWTPPGASDLVVFDWSSAAYLADSITHSPFPDDGNPFYNGQLRTAIEYDKGTPAVYRDGTDYLLFTVDTEETTNPGDHNYRAEINELPVALYDLGDEVWWGARVITPSTWVQPPSSVWEINQWHDWRVGLSPQTHLATQVQNAWANAPGAAHQVNAGQLFVVNSCVSPNEYYDTGINVGASDTLNIVMRKVAGSVNHADVNKRGILTVWVNGVIVYNNQNMQNVYTDYLFGGQPKWGAYVSGWRSPGNVANDQAAGVPKLEARIGTLRIIRRDYGDASIGADVTGDFNLVDPAQ